MSLTIKIIELHRRNQNPIAKKGGGTQVIFSAEDLFTRRHAPDKYLFSAKIHLCGIVLRGVVLLLVWMMGEPVMMDKADSP